MHRLLITLAVLVVANVSMAGAVALWVTPPLPVLPSPLPQQLPPAIFWLSPEARGLDTRVRAIVLRELEGAGAAVNQPAARAGENIASQGGALQPGRSPQSDAPPLPRGPRGGSDQRFRNSPPEGTGAASAVLTPFGLYRSGPIGVGLAILSLITLLGAGSAMLYLAPARLRVLRESLTVSVSRTFLLTVIGLLGYLLGLLLMVILVTLVVSVLFVPIVLVALAAATFLGVVSAALALGGFMRSKLRLEVASPVLDLALGMLVLFPLGLVPVLGWVVVLAAACTGFGAILFSRFGADGGWSLRPLQEGNSDASYA